MWVKKIKHELKCGVGWLVLRPDAKREEAEPDGDGFIIVMDGEDAERLGRTEDTGRGGAGG